MLTGVIWAPWDIGILITFFSCTGRAAPGFARIADTEVRLSASGKDHSKTEKGGRMPPFYFLCFLIRKSGAS